MVQIRLFMSTNIGKYWGQTRNNLASGSLADVLTLPASPEPVEFNIANSKGTHIFDINLATPCKPYPDWCRRTIFYFYSITLIVSDTNALSLLEPAERFKITPGNLVIGSQFCVRVNVPVGHFRFAHGLRFATDPLDA